MQHVRAALQPLIGTLRTSLEGKTTLSRATRALERKAKNPTTFNQKVFHKMAFDRRPILATFADKVAVHDFVRNQGCGQYLPKRYGIYDSLPAHPSPHWTHEYVVKASHGSGGVVVLWEGAGATTIPKSLDNLAWDSFVIRPTNLDWNQLQQLTSRWMKQNFYWARGRYPEWAYKEIAPKIIVEELLLEHDGRPARDYKFFMFNGKCRLIHDDIDRFGDHRRSVYDPDWNLLPFTIRFNSPEEPSPIPKNFAEMISLAEQLSYGMDFVRVDLYDTVQGVRFGEITNYPAGGIQAFHPSKYDRWLGQYWEIPDYTSTHGTRKIH